MNDVQHKVPVSGCGYHSFAVDEHLTGKSHGEPWRVEDSLFRTMLVRCTM